MKQTNATDATAEKRKAISMLLAAWPSSNDTKSSLAVDLQVYLMALQGISAANAGRAVRAFVSGAVEGHNNEFRPRAARLAEYARSLDAADRRLHDQQARIREQQKLIENQWSHQLSAEERAAQVERMLARKVERAPIVKEPVHMAADKRAKPWHDKAELSASMERIRAYEEAKGQPIPEAKPCTG